MIKKKRLLYHNDAIVKTPLMSLYAKLCKWMKLHFNEMKYISDGYDGHILL